MSDHLVTLGKFMSVTEAQVVKAVLGEAGIEAFIQNELTLTQYAPLSITQSGVEVQVLEEDLEEAQKVLEEARESDPAEDEESAE